MNYLSFSGKLLCLIFCLLLSSITFAQLPQVNKSAAKKQASSVTTKTTTLNRTLNESGNDEIKSKAIKNFSVSLLPPVTAPRSVSASPANICAGSNVSLTATCAAGTVTWYSQASGGTAIGTGSPLTKSPTITTSYYASCYVSSGSARVDATGAESSRVSAGTVTVTSIPADPTSVAMSSSSICTGEAVTLTASCSTGTVTWYAEASSIGTGTGLSHSPTAYTRYFAKCINGSCESNFTAAGDVTINSKPDSPTGASVSETNICSGTAVILTANCNTGTLTWYTQATGGTAIGIETDLSQSPTENTTYYAACAGEFCESARIATEAVSVTLTPAIPTGVLVSQTNILIGTAVSLTATCSFGTVTWYNQGEEGDAIGTGSGFSIIPSATVTYYASCKNGSCESSRVTSGEVTVISLNDPTEVSVNKTSIVNGAKVILSATCSGGQVIWYNQESGGNEIGAGTVVGYYPSQNTTFYATCRNGVYETTRTATSEVSVINMPQLPYVVKDINPGSESAYPDYFVNLNGTLFFIASDPEYGQELWKSDGTQEGTVMVKDIITGADGPGIYLLRKVGNKVFFVTTGTPNTQLWVSNGEESGTIMLKEINVNNFIIDVNGTAFFDGADDHGTELWKSDGTVEGTVLVKDIVDGGSSSAPSSPVNVNGTLFFSAMDDANGAELWKSDGTADGTILVKDVRSGATGSNPVKLTNVTGKLYFIANDGTHGVELWVSDGTTDGTKITKDIRSGSSTSNITSITEMDGVAYMIAHDGVHGNELWRSDGTDDGTYLVKDIKNGSGSSDIMNLVNLNGFLYFGANDGINGKEFWKSDGTEGGTSLIKDINPGPDGSFGSYPIVNVGGTLYFSGDDGTSGATIWKSDGSADGTMIVKDINAGPLGSYSEGLTNVNGKLFYYSAPTDERFNYGYELWSLGTCTDANKMVTTGGKTEYFNRQAQLTSDTLTCHCDVFNQLMTTIKATGAYPLSSGLVVKEWIDETVTAAYVRRHYEIDSPDDAVSVTAGTGRITLYFTQSDFDAYNNAVSDDAPKLPADSTDEAGKINIAIARYAETSGDETGLPDTYTGDPVLINPENSDIVWNNSLKRWEVSFATVGLGGFFVKAEAISSPTSVSVSQTAICAGAGIALTATCDTGTLVWYNQATGGSAIGTGTSLVQNPTITTTYYALCNEGSVNSERVATSEVVVAARPGNATEIDVSQTSICNGEQVTLTASCETGTVIWYNQLSVGSVIGSGTSLSVSPGTPSATYYVSCRLGSCESSRTATQTISVAASSTPTNVAVDKVALCSAASVSLTATCSIGTLTWYNQATGGVSIGTGTELSQTPTGNTTYYASCKGENCESARVSTGLVELISLTAPTSLSVNKTTLISGGSVKLSGSCTSGSIVWYTQASGGAIIGEGLSVTYYPTGNTTFYASCRKSICETERVATNQVMVMGMAQLPYLLKDINATAASSNANNFVNIEGTVYFSASSATQGNELWKTDGTPEGTVLIKDINPSGSSNPGNLTDVSGTLLFSANDGVNGEELWKSDGTADGTVMVKAINDGDGSSPGNFIAINGILFFAANTNSKERELWKSDGTAAGTVLLQDINPNGDSSPSNLTNVNGTLFFVAEDDGHGKELWKSNGTPGGTVMVKDIRSDDNSSSPSQLVNMGGTLYFAARDDDNGVELWKSNGTSGGTQMVKDINSSGNSSPSALTVVGSTLYFAASDGENGTELWRSNGTTGGTSMVTDIVSGSGSSSPQSLIAIDGILYFTATNSAAGTELWKSDGSGDGTTLVKDIVNGSGSSSPASLINFANTLYFIANDGPHGAELWKSNGTDDGTTLVKDIYTGTENSSIQNLRVLGSSLYFSANNGTVGGELWKSDGTESGTTLIKDINGATNSGDPGKPVNVNGTMFITVNDGIHGTELWKSDGTDGGTMLVKDIFQGTSSSSLDWRTNVDGILFFMANDGINGSELWKSDGTPGGTIMVKDINPSGGSSIENITNVNGIAYFVANNGTTGPELWKSDGTSGGTVLVKDIRPGASGSGIGSLTNVNGTLFFVANDGTNGGELWKSNGTAGGTQMVKNIISGSGSSSPNRLANVDGILYFTANDVINGSELWRSDGTSDGTYLVKNINPGNSDAEIASIIGVNGIAYFDPNNGTNGRELWRSDGTPGGTYLVKDIHVGEENGDVDRLVNVNGTLYFSANDGINGNELWKSDGTLNGTVMVKDIVSGADGSYPFQLTNVNGILYFSASNEVNGNELWKSDGTSAGTVLVKDVVPGASSSTPYLLTDINGKLYYQSNAVINGTSYGYELWSLGTCTEANKIVSASNRTDYFNSQKQTLAPTTTCHCDLFNSLISSTDSVGAAPISGKIDAKVWIDTEADANYVKRHYEINPAANAATATGKVTLYFTQAEFYTYFLANQSKPLNIPMDHCNYEAIPNIRIERRGGTSSDQSGKPNTYSGEAVTINPADEDIEWDASKQLWEVKFNTTGFGAFYVKSAELTAPTLVSVDMTTICSGKSVKLSATCDAGTITWYTQATGGSSIGTGTNLSKSPVANTTYYAACEWESNASTRVATEAVTVNTTPANPTSVSVSNTTICNGTSVSLTATCAAGTITWYNQATGGTSIGTGNSLSQSPSSTTTYYASCVDGSCESNREATNQVVVTAIPDSPSGVSVNNTAICNGTSVSLTATCATGTITWYNQETGGTAIGTGNSLSQSPSTNTTYYASCVNGSCESGRAATNQVVVTAMPTTPTSVSVSNTAICNGTSVSLTATCATGTITWYNQETGGTAIGTGNSLSQSPSSNITYYASCINGNCESSRAATNQVVVTAMPATPTSVSVSNTAICNGTPVSLTATCATGTITWYNQATGGTAIGTGNNLSQSPSSTTTYYASCVNGSCESIRIATSQVVVTAIPNNPTGVSANNEAICNGTAISLTATCASGTIWWYNQASGGSPIGLGTTLSQSPSVSTTYYATCKNGSCESSRVATNQVIVTAVPTTPTSVSVSNTAICNGTSVSLTATCATGTITWYNQATGGTAIGTGNNLSQSPSSTITYYASCVNGSCESSRAATNQVVVTTIPTTPTSVSVSSTAICNGTSVSLTATCATGTITWYNQATGGTAIGTGNSLSQSPSSTITYYASCKNGNCESSRAATNQVVVTAIPNTPTSVSVSSTAICSGTSVSLTATCATGTITWYNQATGGTAIGTGNSLSQSPSSTITYYASCKNGNCESSRTATNQVVVTTTPTTPTSVSVSLTAICSGTSVSLTATCATGTITWYNQATGGTAIGTGNSLSQSPSLTVTYYATCKNGSCESTRGTTSQVVVTTQPISPTSVSVSSTAICSGTNVSLTATCSTGTINWYSQATGGTAIGTGNNFSQSPVSNTTYYASCKNGNCESSRVATNQVVITATPEIPSIVSVNNTSICSGTSVSLTATCATGTITWYNQASGGTAIGTGNNLSQSPISTVTYYATCKSGSCESSRISTGEVTVKPKPEKPVITGNTEVCAGSSTPLAATMPISNHLPIAIYNWTGGRTGDPLVVSPTVNSSYRVMASYDGCNSDSSDIFTVTVIPAPQKPVITASNTTICKGSSIVLTGSCPSASDAFYWVAAQLRGSVNPNNERTRTITEPGTYKGYCQTTQGCTSAETSIIITQGTNCSGQNFIKITPEKPVICPNTTVTLTATGCTGTLTWTIGASIKTGTAVAVSPSVNTTYTAQCSTGGSATVDVAIATTSVVISADVTAGKEQVKAVESIESAKKVGSPSVSPSPTMTYEAGKSIILKPGFVAEAGTVFKAEIKTCN